MLDDFFFAWEGADAKSPWRHMRVLEVRGVEAMSSLYSFEIELVRADNRPDVSVTDLVGRRCALRITTKTQPAFRLIHGVVASAEELGDVTDGARYRVVLAPPFFAATMQKKSLIYLEKTIAEIVEHVLTRVSWGAGLTASKLREADPDDGDDSTFKPATATFAMRIVDRNRIDDRDARPYCVQYDESDIHFVSRILEEEGISYHFEHTKTECVLVLSDFDGGRQHIDPTKPLGLNVFGRELSSWVVGTRLRPKSATLDDFNWKKPKHAMIAISPAGVTDFNTHEYPGRYDHSKESGERLAEKREQRLSTEREWAAGEARCRLLGAGSIFRLEHSAEKFNGKYLVTSVRHEVTSRGSFSRGRGADIPYKASIECVRCGTKDEDIESSFRPARVTPRPRILGSQTAIVTADPSAAGAEINVGGPEDVGCVRVHFHWDFEATRLEREPSSCWIRVSHLFAGSNHGAAWHPRVGNEVIVDFLDGDPDRPIVTGRVYNGINKPGENPTRRPTFSAIKSFTSPFNGNFNMLSFEDEAGREEIVVHAARDYNTTVKRNASRDVGMNDSVTVKGSQKTSIDGSQSTSAGSISHNSGSTLSLAAKTQMTLNAGDEMAAGAPIINIEGKDNVNASAPWIDIQGGTKIRVGAPVVEVGGSVIDANAQENLNASAPWIDIKGGAKIRADAAIVEINGATVIVTAGDVTIKGGTVNIKGGQINLNC